MTVNGWLAVFEGFWLSRTVIVNVEEPFNLGLPRMIPLAGSSTSPGGKAPDDTDQMYNPAPPEPITVWS